MMLVFLTLISVCILEFIRIQCFDSVMQKELDTIYKWNAALIPLGRYETDRRLYPNIDACFDNFGIFKIWKWNFRSYIVY